MHSGYVPSEPLEVIDMPFGVHSEVGKLRQVMVHRPGLEHTRLTPSNAKELLFDDVLWVSKAKAEHDAFCQVMLDRGVEVFEAERLLAETLPKPEVKDWVCDHILNEREVGVTAAPRAREWVETAEPYQVAEFLIGGITEAEISARVGLMWESADPGGYCCLRWRTSCSSGTRPAGSMTASRSTR
jgi:arginine deiminase